MRNKTIIFTALSLLLISGAAFTMRRGQDGITKVERGDVVHLLVSPAVVEASSERISLGFEVPGTIAEVFVNEGDRVEAGQALARLDDRLARARVARAEAAVEAARARRDASVRGSRKAEIDAAEAEAASARSTAWERAQTHARIEKLAASNAVSAQQADDAKSAADAARANSNAAEARLALIKEGSRTEARREAEATLLGAAADLEEAKTLLSKSELRAPITGVILRRLAEPGELVTITPPEVVFAMANLDQLQLRVEIDEADVGRIASLQTGFATADAYGAKRFPGKITTITRELGRKTLRTDDPRAKADTRVLEVMFALDDAAELPLGLRMDVHVETVARRDVLTVPMSAIAATQDAAAVVVLENGERITKKIQLGAEDGVRAEVLAGLREGELIAVDGR
jgi:multidrug resistance efflux pump